MFHEVGGVKVTRSGAPAVLDSTEQRARRRRERFILLLVSLLLDIDGTVTI
jgi:hypothetical protein